MTCVPAVCPLTLAIALAMEATRALPGDSTRPVDARPRIVGTLSYGPARTSLGPIDEIDGIRRLGFAFLGRDDRLYVYDYRHHDLKRITLGSRSIERIDVVPGIRGITPWAGRASVDGRVSMFESGTTRIFSIAPGDSSWRESEGADSIWTDTSRPAERPRIVSAGRGHWVTAFGGRFDPDFEIGEYCGTDSRGRSFFILLGDDSQTRLRCYSAEGHLLAASPVPRMHYAAQLDGPHHFVTTEGRLVFADPESGAFRIWSWTPVADSLPGRRTAPR